MEVRQKEVEELQNQSQVLNQEGKGSEEVDGQRVSVERKFHLLLEPLKKRRENLMVSREIHQFNRDVEDEIVSLLTSDFFTFLDGETSHDLLPGCMSVSNLSDCSPPAALG